MQLQYLETLDDAAFGAAYPSQPKFVAKSDPAAQWTRADDSGFGGAFQKNFPHASKDHDAPFAQAKGLVITNETYDGLIAIAEVNGSSTSTSVDLQTGSFVVLSLCPRRPKIRKSR